MTAVGEEKLFTWYRRVCGKDPADGDALLARVWSDFCATGKSVYIVPASRSTTGREERYEYRCENIGCCGASTYYLFF